MKSNTLSYAGVHEAEDRATASPAFTFWSVYIMAALVGFPVVGGGIWSMLSGRPPDKGGVALLALGTVVTTILVAIWYIVGQANLSWPPLAVAAIACALGLCSSLMGIVLGVVLF